LISLYYIVICNFRIKNRDKKYIYPNLVDYYKKGRRTETNYGRLFESLPLIVRPIQWKGEELPASSLSPVLGPGTQSTTNQKETPPRSQQMPEMASAAMHFPCAFNRSSHSCAEVPLRKDTNLKLKPETVNPSILYKWPRHSSGG
jgi:hypothetical protein